jgi:hypothetical protein
MANARMMIGTSTSHAAVSIVIDELSIGTRRRGMQVREGTRAQFEQLVLLNPLARVCLACEASCCPDHRAELAQGYTVTAILADEDVIH